MKKRHFTKILCLALALMMSVSMLPFTANAAPTTEIASRILREATRKYSERTVELTINEMKFTGRLYNTALSDNLTNLLDDFVKETMKEMDLDFDKIDNLYKQIDKMLENMGFSKADMDRVIGNIFDVAGGALGILPGGGLPGDILTVVQGIMQIVQGKPEEAGKTSGEGLGTKAADKLVGDKPGKGLGLYKAASVIADEWTKDQKKYREMREGLDATRTLADFYSRVGNKVRDYIEKNKDKNVIYFDEAAAPKKTFILFGAQCTEIWTLDMGLKYKGRANSNPNVKDGAYEGNYEGNYTITIEYDLGAFAEKLPDLVQTPEWRGQGGLYSTLWKLWEGAADLKYSLSESGSRNASRTLKGQATARILHENGIITPNQTSDEKNADSFNSTVTVLGDVKNGGDTLAGAKVDFDMVITADDDGFKIKYARGTETDKLPQAKAPQSENFWKRGDEAKQGWKLTVLPRK